MNVKIIVFGIFIAAVFTGCAPKYIDVNKSLSEGKSVVIVPTYYEQGTKMKWEKIGEKKRYIPLINPELLNKQHFEDGFLLNNNYQAFVMDNGTYYIKNFSSSIKSANYTLKLPIATNIKEYKSTIGNIWVEKTPEREKDTNTGKLEDVTSYYEMRYVFVDKDNIDSPKSVGTITINQSEIVLIPAVWIDIALAESSCEFEDDSFWLFDILDVFLRPSTLLYSNDEDTWYWSCPIKSITINIKTKSVDDFISKIELSPFSKEDFSNITVRNFEFGKLLKQAKKSESFEDGVERYIISGDVGEE
jgi:hypothetical protein